MSPMFLSSLIDLVHQKYGSCIAVISVPQGEEISYSSIEWIEGKNNFVSETEFKKCVDSAKALEYKENRANEYPSIGDQLDALFHAGVFPEEMANKIQEIKNKYPKVAE